MITRLPLRRPGIALGLSLVLVAMLATPTVATPALATTGESADDLETMGDYRAADYAQDAAALPADLVEAVARDLDLAPAQYLAEAAAAFQAVAVVDSLEAAGVDVLGSAMTGTELTVHVATDADAAVVEEAGAIPTFDEPQRLDLSGDDLQFAADVYGGEGYYWQDSQYRHYCSIGFAGYDTATSASQFLTAGHCTEGMENMIGTVRAMPQATPRAFNGGESGSSIASALTSATRFGTGSSDSGYDVGRLAALPGTTAQPATATWGGAKGAPRSSTPLPVTGQTAGIVGANLCRSGVRTGWSCGPILAVDYFVGIGDGSGGLAGTVNSIVAKVCAIPGDSGGAAMVGNAAVGVTSWTNSASGCTSSSVSGYFPMMSATGQSVASAYGSTWELGVTLATPVVTALPTSRAPLPSLAGTLAKAAPGVRVQITLDGDPTPVADVAVVDGRWSATLPPVRDGFHSYSVVATFGELSSSAAATGRFETGVTSERLPGTSRYRIGADLARSTTVSRVASTSVVYLVNANATAGVLTSVSAAAMADGVVLLTSGSTLSAELRAELARLRPQRIVLVGTTTQLPATIARQATALVGAQRVTRINSTVSTTISRALLARAWAGSPTPIIYVTTGADQAGALAASAAAASMDAPLVTLSPTARTMDALTLSAIARLKPESIRVVGSVHSALLAQLARIAPVTRLATAGGIPIDVAVNRQAFVSADRVFVTTRGGLAAALGAAPVAGATGSPTYVIPTTCVPEIVLDELGRLGASEVTLIGAGTRSPDLLTWPRCP